jgi:hypothetical protein
MKSFRVRPSRHSPPIDDLPIQASLVEAMVQRLPESVKAGMVIAEMIAVFLGV